MEEHTFNCPPVTWQVPEHAVIRYGSGENPFDGMTISWAEASK
jgi:hypothetical protein